MWVSGSVAVRCALVGHSGGAVRWQCSAASGLARPIILNGGVRAIATHWVYECPRTGNFCKNGTKRLTYGAAEVGILKQVEQQLGRHVRCMYPVELEYAFPRSFMHLASCLTGLLETTIVTYMPTDAWARILKNQGRERYDQQAANYESHCAAWNKGLRAVNQPAVGFPSFPCLLLLILFLFFCGRRGPLSTLRSPFWPPPRSPSIPKGPF